MPNSFVTEKKLAAIAAGIDAYAPLLTMGNRSMESQFADSAALSDIARIKIGGYGTTYQATDMTGNESDITIQEVPLQILPWRKKFALTKLQDMFYVDDKPKDIIKPFCGEMAYTLNQVIADRLLKGANTATVATSASFAQLSAGIANVEETLMAGDIYGMLGISYNALMTNAGTSQFDSSRLEDMMYQNMIGNYNGVEFTKAPMPVLATAGIFPAGTISATTSVDAFGLGTTTATFTATSAPGAAISIKAGTLIKLAGVEAVGEMGRNTGKDRVFVVQSDVTIPTNANTVPVALNLGTIYFSGPKKNVSVSAISSLAVTNLLEASSRYYTGVVWNRNELLIGVKGLTPFASLDSKTVNGADGFPVRMTVESNANGYSENNYLDTLFNAGCYTGRSISSMYLKIS